MTPRQLDRHAFALKLLSLVTSCYDVVGLPGEARDAEALEEFWPKADRWNQASEVLDFNDTDAGMGFRMYVDHGSAAALLEVGDLACPFCKAPNWSNADECSACAAVQPPEHSGRLKS